MSRSQSGRVIFRVQWFKDHWRVTPPGENPKYVFKETAIDSAVRLARDMRVSEGSLTQVVIYKKNGRIQSERTYGKDPKRSKG